MNLRMLFILVESVVGHLWAFARGQFVLQLPDAFSGIEHTNGSGFGFGVAPGNEGAFFVDQCQFVSCQQVFGTCGVGDRAYSRFVASQCDPLLASALVGEQERGSIEQG